MNLPHQIEIEINTHCNRSCDYCPNSISSRVEQGEMEEELFFKIIDELAEHQYAGKISYMFYNEPLLAQNFYKFSQHAKEKLPLATFVLYSNGSKIKDTETFDQINQSIDHFIITKHHQEKDYPFEDVLQTLPLEKSCKVNFRHHSDIDKYNRAGLLEIENKEAYTETAPCHVPSFIMTISVEGNVISCFEDYHQKFTLGNLKEQSISEIWNTKEYSQFRADLLAGKRSEYKNCSNCNRLDLPDTIRRESPNKHFIDEKEEEAILSVLRNKKLYRYQKEESVCQQFEREFSAKLGFNHAILVNSGTNALVAAMMALEINPGDEVIIPSYTYIATAAAVITLGAIPVVANIDKTLCLIPEEVEQLITEKTKAIIAVHMDGLASPLNELIKIKEKYNLFLIEDTAQALGGKYDDKYLGTIGDIGCYSLNRDKNITTGEGGIVATNDPALYERLLCASDHGHAFNPLHQNHFKHIKPFLGHSMRVSELTGAMALAQLGKLDTIISSYKERKNILVAALDEYNIPRGHDLLGECHSSLHLQFDNPKICAFISKKLMGLGIDFLPLTLRPAHAVWKWGEYLGAQAAYSTEANPLKDIPKTKYHKFNFLGSFQLLSSTLKLEINPRLSLEETELLAQKIRLYLKEFIYRYNNLQHKA